MKSFILGLLLFLSIWPRQASAQDFLNPEIQKVRETVYATGQLWSLRTVLDSLERWLSKIPKGQMILPEQWRDVPATSQIYHARAEREVLLAWKQSAGRAADSIRFVAIRSPQPPLAEFQLSRWAGFRGSILADEGRACVFVTVRSQLFPEDVRACAMLARFGQPGAAMRRWLVDGMFGQLQAVDLLGTNTPSKTSINTSWFEMATDGWLQESGQVAALLARFVFKAPNPPYAIGVRGLACLRGQEESCGEALWGLGDLDSWSYYGTSAQDSRIPANVFPWLFNYFPDHLFSSRRFTADLIRQKGEEKFRELWKANDADFDSAFRRIYGMSLNRAVATWVNERHTPAPSTWDLALGTEIPWRGTLVSLLWLFPFGLLAALTARSRQMGR